LKEYCLQFDTKLSNITRERNKKDWIVHKIRDLPVMLLAVCKMLSRWWIWVIIKLACQWMKFKTHMRIINTQWIHLTNKWLHHNSKTKINQILADLNQEAFQYSNNNLHYQCKININNISKINMWINKMTLVVLNRFYRKKIIQLISWGKLLKS